MLGRWGSHGGREYIVARLYREQPSGERYNSRGNMVAVQLGGRIVVWTASGFGMAGELRQELRRELRRSGSEGQRIARRTEQERRSAVAAKDPAMAGDRGSEGGEEGYSSRVPTGEDYL